MKGMAAFTILELLTAMAVLALILVMLVQVVNGLLQSTRTQNQQMDSVASARQAIDVMATDFRNAVVGENAAILIPTVAGSNAFALLTSRRGAAGAMADHRFLAVRYSTNATNQIIRSYGSVGISDTDLLAATVSAATNDGVPLAKGILGIQARAVGDGTNTYPITNAASANWATNSYNGLLPPTGYQALITRAPAFAANLTNRTRAIEIWIAAVDEQNYALLQGSSKVATAQASLGPDPQAWRAALDACDIPAQAKAGIRVLNKTIPIR